ncbi:putative protein TPRXL [Drosophila rhopaloa]|uniref:Uncharacterized protein n=1 Tax=Drosophila rhopaloa TaxID=1041015 RepID=A0A6P4ERI1_DRORH|nr:putative protein TPRXL [Drosophila rhopaloa]
MTYSHNSVRNNIRMTTASATKSIRLKKGAASATSASNSSTPSPTSAPVSPTSASAPATPLVTAHSNSIASSTNNAHFLSFSPTNQGLGLSSLTTPPNQRQRQLQSQSQSTGSKGKHQQQQQQRQSPQQQGSSGGGGFFFANNNRRNGGGRSPQGAMQVRQSPATILGGGFSPGIGGGSARKQRKSPPLGGKISPQQMQMQQQQHPLIPTALTHFAGSKCFDAPAPTALPKPPQHWTLSMSEGKYPLAMSSMPKFQVPMQTGRSKRNLLDDFDTHNLKLLLNVQS